MNKYEDIEKSTEQKFKEKDKKKQPKMHISGRGVFNLKKIIENKSKENNQKK